MLKIEVPILTEEYKIIVYLGTEKELIKHGALYLGESEKKATERIERRRGIAVNTIKKLGKPPILLINTDYPIEDGIATIGHEASHAMDYISNFIGMYDTSGEFHAHGIASVLRHSLKKIKKTKK